MRVVARDASFTISRRSAPVGSTVRFVVRNQGRTSKRFSINGRRTRVLARGKAQTLAVRFPRRGTYPFRFTVGNRVPKGLRGTFTVVPAVPAPPPPEPSPTEVSRAAVLTQVGTFERPVLVTAPAGDDRVFVVEQTGAVRIVRDGQVLERPFLDFRDHVTALGESGLLSVAFAPDYAQSGLVYVFYNSRSGPYGDIRISELRRDATNPDVLDPSTERVLLTIPKPYENHNGGMLQFGPDGYLYASVGDGDPGAVNRAGHFAQTLDDLLGNILRIDPRGGDPYARARGQPVRRPRRRHPPRDLGLRPAQPVAVLDRPSDEDDADRRRGRHSARGGRSRSPRPVGSELRMAVLRGHARLRRDGLVSGPGRSAVRLPARQRRLRRHRRRRRLATRASAPSRAATSTATCARGRSPPWGSTAPAPRARTSSR